MFVLGKCAEALADLGGHAPLRVQILSFRHTKFSKRNLLGSQQPPYIHKFGGGWEGGAGSCCGHHQRHSKDHFKITLKNEKMCKVACHCLAGMVQRFLILRNFNLSTISVGVFKNLVLNSMNDMEIRF